DTLFSFVSMPDKVSGFTTVDYGVEEETFTKLERNLWFQFLQKNLYTTGKPVVNGVTEKTLTSNR
ncbi:MAG: hypothetical protein JXR25_15555, partial [Pontiellaceae bacterium]|nr:hypothetical protein [Pontiellaceae bacterium]MBN2786236.1 hypothetical protein [Pontiellaceae bacterium]